MVTHLYLGVVISAVFAVAVAQPAIKVVCAKDSIKVKWRVGSQLVPYAARLFIGSCMPSKWNVLNTGEGEAYFDYKFSDCGFVKKLKGKYIVYEGEVSFRPQARGKPAVFQHPIECIYKRPEGWIPSFLNPGAGVSEGHSKLVFHMALLNEQLTGVAKTNVVPLGSFMPIWAAVEQKSHQPLLLLMEECVAATTPELLPNSQIHPIISNKGCLLESKMGNSMFLPRYHSSAIILYLQSFTFGIGGEVYIHCNLVVWDQDALDETKKACHVKEHGSWELLDDPSQSSLCHCCESTCASKMKRAADWDLSGRYNSVLGPIIIMDQSNSTLVESDSAIDSKEMLALS
ncbi:zona pellucida glycoprotein 3f, tandem duplicate 2 [Xenentodon cancila]